MPVPHNVPEEAGIHWIITPTEGISKPMRVWQQRKIRAILSRLSHTGGAITRWMRQNAVWQDRTGLARRSLKTSVHANQATGEITINMYYENVPYDIWLETMQAGKFSILGPALDHWGEKILQDVQNELMRSTISEERIFGGE